MKSERLCSVAQNGIFAIKAAKIPIMNKVLVPDYPCRTSIFSLFSIFLSKITLVDIKPGEEITGNEEGRK